MRAASAGRQGCMSFPHTAAPPPPPAAARRGCLLRQAPHRLPARSRPRPGRPPPPASALRRSALCWLGTPRDPNICPNTGVTAGMVNMG